MAGRLDGKVALVTGAASGIGAATARRFAAEGAKVLMTDVQDDLGQTVAAAIGAQYMTHDVSDRAVWKQVMARLKDTYGRLDVVMNNAGMVCGQNIEEITDDVWQRLMDVNLKGVMLGCQFGIKLMKENPEGPSGSLINVSSITGFVGLPSDAPYTASKGAVRLMTKSIAVHCAQAGYAIRCNSIHPGTIRTGIIETAIEAMGKGSEAIFNGLQPGGKMGTPDDIANMALFLASDEAAFCNGAEYLVDSAMIAGASVR